MLSNLCWLGSLFQLGLYTFVKNTNDNGSSCSCFLSFGGVTTKEIALFVVMTAQESKESTVNVAGTIVMIPKSTTILGWATCRTL
jgi:hypothetical protein